MKRRIGFKMNLESLQNFKRNKGNMEGKTKERKQKNKKFKV